MPEEINIAPPILRPVIAAGLSLVFAGLGHLFLRKYLRAAMFSLMAGFIYMISDYWPKGMLLNLIFFIITAFDAFSIGRRGFGIF